MRNTIIYLSVIFVFALGAFFLGRRNHFDNKMIRGEFTGNDLFDVDLSISNSANGESIALIRIYNISGFTLDTNLDPNLFEGNVIFYADSGRPIEDMGAQAYGDMLTAFKDMRVTKFKKNGAISWSVPLHEFTPTGEDIEIGNLLRNECRVSFPRLTIHLPRGAYKEGNFSFESKRFRLKEQRKRSTEPL